MNCLVAALTLSGPSVLLAQSAAVGTIEGRVLNAASGVYLNNARVVVVGTNLEAFTTMGGDFRIANVPAGSVTLRAHFLGLQEQSAVVTVAAGQTVRQNFDLLMKDGGSGDTVKMEAFTVSDREMNAQMTALNEQRFSPNIKNVVSIDEFGNTGEGNIGEILKFMPGIQIDYSPARARSVGMRGFSPEQTHLTIDGVELPSGVSTESRQVQTDGIQVSGMERIEVTKLPTPDSPASAMAGSINVVSKSGFDRREPQFTFRAYTLFNTRTAQHSKIPSVRDDLMVRGFQPGFDFSYVGPTKNRSIGITLSGSYNIRSWDQELSQPDWDLVRLIMTSYQTAPGHRVLVQRRKNVALGIDWKLSNTDSLNLRFQQFEHQNRFGNALMNVTFGAGATGDEHFTQGAATAVGTIARTIQNSTIRNESTPYLSAVYRHDGPVWKIHGQASYARASFNDSDIRHGAFGNVAHSLTNLIIRGTGHNEGFPRNIGPAALTATNQAGAPADIHDVNLYTIASASGLERDVVEVKRQAKLDFSRSFGGSLPLSMKTGLALNQRQKDLRANTPTWTFRPTANAAERQVRNYDILADRPVLSGFGPETYLVSANKAYALYQQRPDFFVLNEPAAYQSSTLASKYLEETISAAYVRGDLRYLENRLWIVGGVRFERTDTKGVGPLDSIEATFARGANGAFLRSPTGALVPITTNALETAKLRYKERAVSASRDYDDFFPSLNTSYNLTDTLIVKAGYAETLGRPNLNFIIPGATVSSPDAATPRITIVNTGLDPWSARSLDLSLEWYGIKGGFGSIGLFQKNIRNFFGQTILPATSQLLAEFGFSDDYLDYEIVTNENLPGSAKIRGVEFNYRQELGSFHPWLKGFHAFFNLTEMRLRGSATSDFSDFTPGSINWGLAYVRPKFALRVNTTQKKAKSLGVVAASATRPAGTQNYEAADTRVGMSGEYVISKHFTFEVAGRSINTGRQPRTRYAPDTPGYARAQRLIVWGSEWTIGFKGVF